MRPSVKTLTALTLPGLLALAATALGAVPVEESVGSEPARSPQGASVTGNSGQVPPAPGSADARRLAELFYQLQILQQELQDLRGLVEEQGYQLDRLARDQKEQYIDLDGRVAALTTGGGSRPAASTGSGASTTGAPNRGSGDPGSERDAYSRAFDLMKSRDFAASADAFNTRSLTENFAPPDSGGRSARPSLTLFRRAMSGAASTSISR